MGDGPWLFFWVGLALRLVLVGVGVVVDHWAEQGYLSVRYTDVDYHVFTDAALLLFQGSSPYDKFSYRYPPVLAALLVPIHFLAFPAFGKVLFCLVDAAAVFLVFDICKLRECEGEGQRRHLRWSWIWALNPLSSVICSRGSADSLVNLVVLATVQLALRRGSALSGACLGLAIYLRLYPVIFLPAFAVHLYCSRGGAQAVASFVFAAVICGSACVGLSWLACGQRYWDEAVAFHVWRKDHRHNFSPHFYSTYLHKSEAGQAGKGSGDVVVTSSSLSSMLLPFCPQLLLLAATATSLAPRELEMCLLVQTLIFVAFNKVCTAQYFTWYLCLLPLVMVRVGPEARLSVGGPARWACVLVVSSCGLWLWRAHRLEMLGLNSFPSVWAASLALHVGQCALAAACIRAARKTKLS